jgi:hypothetical protein
MYELLMVGLGIAAVILSGLVVVALALTVRMWDAWWARAAHALVFLAAAAALAFGIHWGVHVVPWGGCVHHPCVPAPGD